MKQLFLLLFLALSAHVFSQNSLSNFNYSRNKITATGMKVLGSLGIANIGVGTAGWASSRGGSGKYFYQMSTLWGVANFSVAVLGFSGAQRNMKKELTTADNLKAQQNIEKTFLMNGALDFAYIGTGMYLNKRNNNKLKGYGPSVIMQGIFLLLFDGAMYKTQRINGNKLRNFLEKNTVAFSDNKLCIICSL